MGVIREAAAEEGAEEGGAKEDDEHEERSADPAEHPVETDGSVGAKPVETNQKVPGVDLKGVADE